VKFSDFGGGSWGHSDYAVAAIGRIYFSGHDADRVEQLKNWADCAADDLQRFRIGHGRGL